MMVLSMMIYFNYLLTITGIGMIIISLFLIISDKIKGENIYYNLCVKEQDIKNAIDEANELIDELVYTSETIVNEIEDYIVHKRKYIKEEDNTVVELTESGPVEDAYIMTETNAEVVPMKEEKESHTHEKKEKEKDILKMYSDGMTVDEIAKRLQMGKGEVMLILSLSRGIKSNESI